MVAEETAYNNVFNIPVNNNRFSMLLFTATLAFNNLTILQGNYSENISLFHINRIETSTDVKF